PKRRNTAENFYSRSKPKRAENAKGKTVAGCAFWCERELMEKAAPHRHGYLLASLALSFAFSCADRLPQLRRCVRHIDVLNAERRKRVHDRICHRGRCAVGTAFAHAFDTDGTERIRRDRLA